MDRCGGTIDNNWEADRLKILVEFAVGEVLDAGVISKCGKIAY